MGFDILWNNYHVQARASVWERTERPRTGCVEDNHFEDGEDEKMDSYHDHDYCAVPGPAAVDLVLIEREETEDLQNKVE